MGVLRIRVRQVNRLSGALGDYCKGECRFYLRISVRQLDQCSEDEDVLHGDTRGSRWCESDKFRIINPLSYPCATEPALADLGSKELSLTTARFSSLVAVDLMKVNRDRPLCQGFLSMQNDLLGLTRKAKLSLYPMQRDVSDDTPQVSALAEILLDVTPEDFCPYPSSVDHVTRGEEDAVCTERLRLFLAAYEPSRLPFIDAEAAAARDGPGGWPEKFCQLLRTHNHKEPQVRTVRVSVKQGFNMPRERSSYVDPYVRVFIKQSPGSGDGIGGLGEVYQTATKKDLENPEFNETFELKCFHGSDDVLGFRLWDYDPASPDDLIGDAILPLGFLVRGVPSIRTLNVFKASMTRCTLRVEITALNFGLDSALYGDLVDEAVTHHIPRLTKYYNHYAPQKLRTIEQDLIDNALVPGGMDRLVASLVAKHGLEPGKNAVRVVIDSIQNIVEPKRRAKVDLSKHFYDGDGSDKKCVPSFKVRVGSQFICGLQSESATPSRVTFKSDENANSAATALIVHPESDTIRVEVWLNHRYESPKSSTFSCDVLAGSVSLSVRRLVINQAKTRTHNLVFEGGRHGTNWFNGSVGITLFSEHVGVASPSMLPSAAGELLPDGEIEAVHRRRLGGLLWRYKNAELPKLDTILDGLLDPQAYIDDLIKTHGPEPGTYRVSLTIRKCNHLPKLELTGAGLDPYVTIKTKEEQFTTAVVKGLSPMFEETFELDILNPKEDCIHLTVMDYDSNSADDCVSTAMIPVKSLTGEVANRVLPLCTTAERLSQEGKSTARVKEGTIEISAKAIGFGPTSSQVGAQNNPSGYFMLPELEDSYRRRIFGLLYRYARSEASQYEALLWRSIDGAGGPEGVIAELVAKYGLEEGTGLTTITVDRLEGLTLEKPENFRGGSPKLKIVKKCCPYVVVTVPRSDGTPTEVLRTKGPPEPSTDGCAVVAASVVVDVERPMSDVVAIAVHNSDVIDKEFGTVFVSLAALAHCKGAANKRSVRLPVVHGAGTASAYVAGWATVSTMLNDFDASALSSGIPKAMHYGGDAAEGRQRLVLPEIRVGYTERVVGLFERYARHLLGTADATVAHVEGTATDNTEGALEAMLASLIKRYGPEPGTYVVHLQVLGCRDLPRIEIFSPGDPYVVASVAEKIGNKANTVASCRTGVSKPTINPVFSHPDETLLIDLVHPNTAPSITLTVMDYDGNSKDDEWCRAVIPFSSFCSRVPITRWVPLVPLEDGLLPEYVKTLPQPMSQPPARSNYRPPQIGFTVWCEGFGDATPDRISLYEESAAPYRERAFRLLHRYAPHLLAMCEVFLWPTADNASAVGEGPPSFTASGTSPEQAMKKLVATHGREEGNGVMTITLHTIEKLEKKMVPCKTAKPYIELIPEPGYLTIPPVCSHAPLRCKTQKPAGPHHMSVEETFIFDLQDPDATTNFIQLRVVDDVVGTDYEFGTVVVTAANGLLQRGVPRKRSYPIVHDANTSEARIVGYVTATLLSDFVTRTEPVDEEVDNAVSKRLIGMYKRYKKASLHAVDLYAGIDRLGHLEEMIRRYGPEPGTYRVQVTISRCKDLPRVEMTGAGCDPYVVVECAGEAQYTKVIKSNLNPTFDETFDVDVVNTKSDRVRISVFDYDSMGDDDLVGSVTVPLCSLSGEAITRSLALAPSEDVASKLQHAKKQGCPAGYVEATLRAIGFGPASLPHSLETETKYRKRVLSIYAFYGQQLTESYEEAFWRAPSMEDALRQTVAKYGPEPGSREITVTVKSITELVGGNGKPVSSATPYVKIEAPLARTGFGEDELRTKTTSTSSANHPQYNEAVTFELRDPTNDTITLRVMDDVVGKDYEFGWATFSCRLLQKGVARQRTFPICKLKDGGMEVQERGTITVELFSSCFGRIDAWDVGLEQLFTDRLRRLYTRYRPGSLTDVDDRVSGNLTRMDAFMRDEVQKLGPEPGTYTLTVALTPPPDAQGNTFRVSGVMAQDGTLIAETGTPNVFEVDLTSPTGVVHIVEHDRSQRVVSQARFSASIARRDGRSVRRALTLAPLHHLDNKEMLKKLRFLDVVITSSTCGSTHSHKDPTSPPQPSDDSGAVEIENSYRSRMTKLLIRSAPEELINVDALVLGVPEPAMEANLQTLIARHGSEDGETTVSLCVRMMDDLAVEGSAIYAKVYVSGTPICKKLLADALPPSASSVARPPPAFSTPTDCLHANTTDVIQIKIATQGMLTSKVLGRCCFPTRYISLGRRMPDMDGDNGSAQAYELRCWCFNEETREYAGRVTVWMRIKGFQPLPPSEAVAHGEGKMLEALFFKELLAGGWRVNRGESDASIASFVPRALLQSPKPKPLNSMVRDACFTSLRRSANADSSIVFLHVLGCRKLPTMDTFGTSDTFVEMHVGHEGTTGFRAKPNQRTRIVSGTLNPTFRFHRDDMFVLEFAHTQQIAQPAFAATSPDASEGDVLSYGGGAGSQVKGNQPAVQLLVKDKDPGSEQLIGTVALSVELLAAGFYHVDAEELLDLTASAGTGVKELESWIAANERHILRLPVILPPPNPAATGSVVPRGEILLVTSTEYSGAAQQGCRRLLQHVQEATPQLNATMKTAWEILAKNGVWRDLLALHPLMFTQLFLSQLSQSAQQRPVSLEARCSQFLSSLMVEFGSKR